MTVAEYWCGEGLDELAQYHRFNGSEKCNVIDIRLRPRQDASVDPFLPSYNASEACESRPINLQTWAENERRALAANSRDHAGRLVVVYHCWNSCGDKYIPFATEKGFYQFLATLGLSQSLPYDFARMTSIPLLREDTATSIGVTCQTPHFEETTLTMTMTYQPVTKTTFAFIMFCPGEMQFFIDELRKLAALSASPLLLPTILYLTTARLLAKRLQRVHDKLRKVEIANGKLKHIHRGQQASRDQHCDRSHIDLVEQHFELTRGLAEFVQSLGEQLCKFSRTLALSVQFDRPSEDGVSSRSGNLSIDSGSDAMDLPTVNPTLSLEHTHLNKFIRRVSLEANESLLKRQRFLDRIEVQADVLYNFKQTRIAEATYIDSAAMKCIALLTMVFLPPNALASVFGANNFFSATSDGTITGVTSTFRHIFIPIAILVTILVLVSWALYTYWYEFKAWLSNSQRTTERHSRADASTYGSGRFDVSVQGRRQRKSRCRKNGVCEPPPVYTSERSSFRSSYDHDDDHDVEWGEETDLSGPIRLGPLGLVSRSRL